MGRKLIEEFLSEKGITLSDRQKEVLISYIKSDTTNKKIAEDLYLSYNGFKTHFERINKIFDVSSIKKVRRMYIQWLESRLQIRRVGEWYR